MDVTGVEFVKIQAAIGSPRRIARNGCSKTSIPCAKMPQVGELSPSADAGATTPSCFEGDDLTYEVVITCAVVNGYAVCAYAVGPRIPVSQFVDHPTPSQLVLSLWSDPDVEGVFWKGHPVP
jgi:hypothetical protein